MKTNYILLNFFLILSIFDCFLIKDFDAQKTFYVALKQNNEGVQYLKELILDDLSNIDSINYGKYLTIEEINKIISLPDISRNVSMIFQKKGIKCQDLSDSLKCTGTVGQLDIIFGIDLRPYFKMNTINYISKKKYKIPREFGKNIIFIDGLSNKLYLENKIKKQLTISSKIDPGCVSREVLMNLYNMTTTHINKKASTGVIEYFGQNGFLNDNLVESQILNSVLPNPIINEHIIGNNTNFNFESQLDVQVMYWGSDNAELWYENFNGWIYSWAIDFVNRKEIPEVISISWGWDETEQCTLTNCSNYSSKQYVERSNIEFSKIVARGTTIIAAAGDSGSPSGTNQFCHSIQKQYGWSNMNPIFPGGSPWVLSIGATYIVNNKKDNQNDFITPICSGIIPNIKCALGDKENSVTFEEVGWTSGSGFTHWDRTPNWQLKLVHDYLQSGIILPEEKFFNKNGRAYPDVVAVGHNCLVNDNDKWQYFDGTSCSSPIFAGIITQLNSHQKSNNKTTLGFINPLLYKIYLSDANNFNDINIGNSTCTKRKCCGSNFGFIAKNGWDPVSGLGTPNVDMIKKYLAKYN
ncbi:Hypothetical protein KVN_LOCUS61 [uncultured virus]|nr:Hypothetical protein KVN_LOCUS61 [uncultured virus]